LKVCIPQRIKEDLNKFLLIAKSRAHAIAIQEIDAGLRRQLDRTVESVRFGAESRMDG
jgi:hypothetical protein